MGLKRALPDFGAKAVARISTDLGEYERIRKDHTFLKLQVLE